MAMKHFMDKPAARARTRVKSLLSGAAKYDYLWFILQGIHGAAQCPQTQLEALTGEE
jgi:hypothetical protein